MSPPPELCHLQSDGSQHLLPRRAARRFLRRRLGLAGYPLVNWRSPAGSRLWPSAAPAPPPGASRGCQQRSPCSSAPYARQGPWLRPQPSRAWYADASASPGLLRAYDRGWIDDRLGEGGRAGKWEAGSWNRIAAPDGFSSVSPPERIYLGIHLRH